LISNHQVNQPTCKYGAPTHNGGRLSKPKVITLSTQEEESLMLLVVLIMKTKTLLLPQETTK
jgi:hypothetical protein